MASLQKGNTGKTTDFEELKSVHRTTYGHFLSKGKWDDKRVEDTQKRESFHTMSRLAGETNMPICVSIDDTIVKKTKPSSHAKHPTEEAGWNYSHLEQKVVYGYQIHATLLGCGDANVPYAIQRCCSDRGTKNDMTIDIINGLPDTLSPVYFLMDSWYTNGAAYNACLSRGFHIIGAMKTNRIIYPNDDRISIKDYAATLPDDCFRSITVKGHTYKVHRYEGSLNKIKHAVVLISYSEGSFGQPQALRTYLCSDTSLSDEDILALYFRRWQIETFFKQQKGYFGFNKSMIRTAKAIDRFFLILSIGYFFCVSLKDGLSKFGSAVKYRRTMLSA